MPTIDQDKFIIITEGEYDAMAVWQETGYSCVSLPQGASHLPKQLLDFFNRFERVYLWLDSDEIGQRAAEKFADVLGHHRTIIIDPAYENLKLEQPSVEEAADVTLAATLKTPKDANDALRAGYDFNEIFMKHARFLNDKDVLSIS